ncbi:hypothetical protein [Streptomyces xylophagus]|uniref:hypothetical protein n=1 Tax=Streptomyces xylophagus TaxID=285514 RepID=UPI0018FEEBB4|nr:hypothetical protein [Streptomyces xylophagus]
MSHSAEHARQPQPGAPDPATRRAPQTLHTQSGHASREPGTSTSTSTDSPGRKPAPELVPPGDRDKLPLRLQQALNTFVDDPRQAVEEADAVFDEVVTQFTDSLAERRRVLRAGWQDQDTDPQTEELRLTLRQYREITERLLHMPAPTGH